MPNSLSFELALVLLLAAIVAVPLACAPPVAAARSCAASAAAVNGICGVSPMEALLTQRARGFNPRRWQAAVLTRSSSAAPSALAEMVGALKAWRAMSAARVDVFALVLVAALMVGTLAAATTGMRAMRSVRSRRG